MENGYYLDKNILLRIGLYRMPVLLCSPRISPAFSTARANFSSLFVSIISNALENLATHFSTSSPALARRPNKVLKIYTHVSNIILFFMLQSIRNMITSNTTDACETRDPCQHGGICISTDTGPICECRTGDYEGEYCEKG